MNDIVDQSKYNKILDDLYIYYGLGSYEGKSNKDLQDDIYWLIKNKSLYEKVMKAYGYEQSDFLLDIRRVKICRICKKPYYSTDRYNKSLTCSRVPYKRYKKDGTPYLATVKGLSSCWMANDNMVRQERLKTRGERP